jgi:WD40 repeat protein
VAKGQVARLWDVASGAERGTVPDVRDLAFAPTGGALAVGSGDGSVRILDAGTLAEVRRLPARADRPVRGLTFSPDGRALAFVAGDAVWFGDPDSEDGWTRLSGTGPAFSADGKTLATHDDTSITLWQVATGQELVVLRPSRYWVGEVVFGRDGKSLATLARHPRDEGDDVTVWPVR